MSLPSLFLPRESLYKSTESGSLIHPKMVHLAIHEAQQSEAEVNNRTSKSTSLIRTSKASVKPRGEHQQLYVKNIQKKDISFGIGPAGTGKTYLAVACAVESLMSGSANRILLVRPAVEAGEKLGFLPGDLTQKIDPYLRPLYDALYEMLGFEKVGKLIVVTGKGIHSDVEKDPYVSKDLSILKYSVPEFINNNQNLMKIITDIKDATIEDGGSGAFYIYLRKKK